MGKSKLTLLIDGNWLLMSRLSVLNGKYQDDNDMCRELKMLMIKSIEVVLRQFPVIDNIIFVSDCGSWRNGVEKPSFITEDYKGNRVKSEDIDWDLIFSNFEDFINKLKSSGITTSKEMGIEGDDWAWYWSTKLNSEGTNVMIWSKDKDLTQLVHTTKDKCFTICWSKESGVIAEKIEEEELDYLFNYEYSVNETLFSNIVEKSKGIEYINPKDVIIDKIIRGDKGDNIFPIIEKKSNTNPEKSFRVYKKDLDNTIDVHNDDNIHEYIEKILKSKSYAGKIEKKENDIFEHFKYNTTLVELNKKNYPKEILDIFENYSTYNCTKDISEAKYKINAEANAITSILDII